MNILIEINHRQQLLTLDRGQEALIRQAMIACYELEGISPDYEVSLSFVTNDEMQELNRTYRHKDEPTDVLSFPMDGPENMPEKLLGDIVISVEKMLEQAEVYDHSVEREMIYLIVHSTLHLLGYDHMDEASKRQMRQKEEQVMEKMALKR